MTAAYSPVVDRHLSDIQTPTGFVANGLSVSTFPRALPIPNFDFKDPRYFSYGAMELARPADDNDGYCFVDSPANEPDVRAGGGESEVVEKKDDEVPSYQEASMAALEREQRQAPYAEDTREFDQQLDIESYDVVTGQRMPPDEPSESSTMNGLQQQQQPPRPQYVVNGERPISAFLPSTPKHPAASAAIQPRPDSQYAPPIVPYSASPSYKPSTPAAIPISSNSRALAQHPTYITPPSSPTPIGVNPIYSYAGSPYTPETNQATQGRITSGAYMQPPVGVVPFIAPEGREICVECAMRDQDMADVDVTSPGVWDRESDVYYQDLCRREAEEEEERVRVRTSNSSSESHAVLRTVDPSRPRARGSRLTEPNLKLWMSMNPREPQARQQTLDLYVKTQTALLEAEALARARALQESRALESRLKDTYDHLRRSTYDVSTSGQGAVDESGFRLRANHSPRRSTSGGGPVPLPLSPVVVDSPHAGSGGGQHTRHQSQSREVTLLESGMIVERVDVRREEKERRREEKREREREKERERERSRARKSSRSSGAGAGAGPNGSADVLSMYSAHSPLPHPQATDSGFYTSASNSGFDPASASVGAGLRERELRDRPLSLSRYSVSQSSMGTGTRAMSVLTAPLPGSGPLTPPLSSGASGVGVSTAGRPHNRRMQSQVSLADTQSVVSSASVNRRSRFFAFRNWSEAWKSRESFAPSMAGMSMSGSMLVALDHEKQQVPIPGAVDIGGNAPTLRVNEQWPRRSLSTEPTGVPLDAHQKKKKGLAKIWKIVTGNKSSKADAQRGREIQPIDRSEDDFPLTPPPPLSYLVNRTSARERSMSASTPRRVSATPSIVAPPPLPSTALPTPTSIRNPWEQIGNGLSVHVEEPYNCHLGAELDAGRSIHPVVSEPDMRQRMQDAPSFNALPPTRVPSSPRPISVYSIHKSLPPLPAEAPDANSMRPTMDAPRPSTMYNLDSQAAHNSPDTLLSPEPAFRREARRQSFGGMTSRPDISRTLPVNGVHTNNGQSADALAQYNNTYNELGASSRSLRRFEDADRSTVTLPKRRSKFGLATLLGKVTGGRAGAESRASVARTDADLPSGRPSESDVHLEGGSGSQTEFNGGASSRSRHNAAPPSRMSVASRKAIEELVDQDPDFVAYRYPSVDQNISLLR